MHFILLILIIERLAMRIAVIDTETTGMGTDDKIVEFGGAKYDVGTPGNFDNIEFLVNPGKEIPPEAMAVHHITNEMAATGLDYAVAEERIIAWLADADAIVAHNAAFDKRYMPQSEKKWVCSFRMARHLIPDLPSYSNQALRYRLGLKPELPEGLYPHRALYDVLVTLELVRHITKIAGGIENLIQLSNTPQLVKKISFGKHAGQEFSSLPLSYLQFLQGLSDKDDDFVHTVKYWVDKRMGRHR